MLSRVCFSMKSPETAHLKWGPKRTKSEAVAFRNGRGKVDADRGKDKRKFVVSWAGGVYGRLKRRSLSVEL